MSESRRSGADPESCYANCFRVGFNAYEFIVEFGQVYPSELERFHTRIVISTPLARSLSETLKRSLGDFDRKFELPQEEK
jgi:hypothetical protein